MTVYVWFTKDQTESFHILVPCVPASIMHFQTEKAGEKEH